MRRWIKHGGIYPIYHGILFRKNAGFCEEARYNQHFVINGKVKKLKGDLEDIVTDKLSNFIDRHNRWASLDAIDQSLGTDQLSRNIGIKGNPFGNPMQQRRYYKSVYMKLPLLIRPFIYFIYRYFIRFGFLDGKEGLIFHVLQGFWPQFLLDSKIFEIKLKSKKEGATINEAVKEIYRNEIK